MEEDEARPVDVEVDYDEKQQGHPAPRMCTTLSDLLYDANTSTFIPLYVSPQSTRHAARNGARVWPSFYTLQEMP